MYLLIIPVKILELFDRFLSVPLVCKDNDNMNTDDDLPQIWIKSWYFLIFWYPVKNNLCRLTLSLARSMTSLSRCKLFIMSTPICSERTIKNHVLQELKVQVCGLRQKFDHTLKLLYHNEFKFIIRQYLTVKCETWNVKCEALNVKWMNYKLRNVNH